MTDAIVVALISLVGTIITVLISAKSTQDKVSNELSTQNALQNNEINHIKEEMTVLKADIKEHNNYAKQLPQIQGKLDLINEKLSVANHRIDDLEKKTD